MTGSTYSGNCRGCRYWKLVSSYAKPATQAEVFLGACRYWPPEPHWPLTEETDGCSVGEPRHARIQTPATNVPGN